MKKAAKIINLILVLIICFSFASCEKGDRQAGNNNSQSGTSQNGNNEDLDNDKEENPKPVIAEGESENSFFNLSKAFKSAYENGPVSEQVLVRTDSITYGVEYYANGSDTFTLLTRSNDIGKESLYQFSGNWKIEYIENSHEQSSGYYIYFYMVHEHNYYDGYNSKLIAIRTSSGKVSVIYNSDVSQMVIAENAVSGYENIGWVIHENSITPINLFDMSELSAKVFDITNRASLPEISGTFFRYPSAGYEVKTTSLTLLDDSTLKITVGEYVTDDSLVDNVIVYTYYYPDEKLKRIQ